MFLQADKGNATVVLDRDVYDHKIRTLLEDEAYTKLKRDPTKRIETDLQKTLKRISDNGELDPLVYKHQLRPSDCKPPYLYDLPKIHKDEVPLRPIVSTIGSPTYALAKHLAKVIAPLAGQTTSFVKNSADFARKMSNLTLSEDTIMVSFDVKSLFTNVPVPEGLQVIREKLERDQSLPERTAMSVDSILTLLEKCLNTTYFTYEGEFYQQNEGAAIGSPLSPILANLFMESFEEEAINTALTKPMLWLRYVDNTFVLWKHGREKLMEFLTHINSRRPSISFTMETEEDKRLPFLDTEVVRNEDGTIRTVVYRKPTHTDRYIHFDSYHHPQVKTGIIRTMMQRGERVCSLPTDLQREKQHLEEVFVKKNGYPKRFVNRALNKQRRQTLDGTTTPDTPIRTITIPYVKGVSERIRRILGRANIRTAFSTVTTIRSLLVKTKPVTKEHDKKGVIYRVPCQDCPKVYIGETGRKLSTRLTEHKRHCRLMQPEKSAIAEHAIVEDHRIDFDGSEALLTEDRFWPRKIKEALLIRRHQNFNQDTGLGISEIWNPFTRTIHA